MGYAAAREESDDRKNLRGMGDEDAAATANLLGEYRLGKLNASGKITTGLSGDYGTTADLNVGSHYQITPDVMLLGSVGTVWADGEYMQERFGVSAAQPARSGNSRHDAEAGIKSVGFSVGINYSITGSWSTNLTFKADQLVGDAADSPITKNDFVPAVYLTTGYRF